MKYILKYQNFNESQGISNSCEIILDLIWNDIESDISNLITNSKKFDFNKDDFKIKEIYIEYNIVKGSENLCNAITYLKDSTIEDGCLTNVKISLNIQYKDLDDPFLYYIKSVIFHEILHIFQHYNLQINDKFRPESFSIGSIIPQLKNHIKTKYANYILDILYHSLSHEMSAQIHQYYMYKREGKKYKKLDDIRNMLNTFHLKEKLDKDEEIEISSIKNHILGSIRFYTNNKNYNKDISKSLWNENSNIEFLIKLSDVIKNKLKWLDKKIKLIDSKIGIKYDETFTYYGDLDDYKYIDSFNFIKNNLNDCLSYYYI